jgi:NDP-sugar pyrophosphorylase family protein
MKAIILAAGGDNLPPFTTSRPKPMLHLSGRYLLESTIEYLRADDENQVHHAGGSQVFDTS